MRVCVTIYLILLCFVLRSQSTYQIGLLPSFNLNKSFKNEWKANLKVESRQLLKEGFFNEESSYNFNNQLSDITIIASRKTGFSSSLAAGFTLRFRGSEKVKRSIQQYSYIMNFSSFRLAHRFSADQTFQESTPVEFRIRYRITVELPLSGDSVDPKEYYFKFNNEYLNSFENGEYDLEMRWIPYLGYKVNDTNKIEVGIDYRVNSFISDTSSQSRFWLSASFYKVI